MEKKQAERKCQKSKTRIQPAELQKDVILYFERCTTLQCYAAAEMSKEHRSAH